MTPRRSPPVVESDCAHARGTRLRAVVVVLTVLLAACAPRYMTSPPLPRPAQAGPSGLTRHIVVVSIDGLRPDAIDRYDAPVLQRLVREGSATLTATTILPSKTLPSHMSMLTGLRPERHGVNWNRAAAAPEDSVGADTVFGVARSRGFHTAAFFSKAKFGVLQRPGTLDFSQAPGGWFGRWSSERTVADVEAYLAKARPHVLFVHLPDPDRAGHRRGWMTPEYGRAVAAVDLALGRLLTAASQAYGSDSFTVLVTADHGGHERDHGSSDARDTTIPWIAWGAGVIPGRLPDGSVSTVDTASTVVWLLGVPVPAGWDGRPVEGAFTAPSTPSTRRQ
jgi:arylsulfatase A-like enzyme